MKMEAEEIGDSREYKLRNKKVIEGDKRGG